MAGLAPWPATTLSKPLTRPATAKGLGLATLGLAAVAALAQLRSAAQRPSVRRPLLRQAAPGSGRPASFGSRSLHGSAALLAASVLVDSTLEHYRGEFENPGMYTPLLTSVLTVLAGAKGAASKSGHTGFTRDGIYATATAVGAAGVAFHLYNVLRRPGQLNWLNLFYAAPIGAPAALSLAGLFGLAAQRVRNTHEEETSKLFGLSAGRVLSGLTSIGLAGTSGEAALLHFRGAFQNPFMWLPVTVPPVASALMAWEAVAPAPARSRWFTRAWLGLTALLGVGGVGFHAYGVARQMGGWNNWSQNLLSGPPLPAPPSFSALALAGLAALSLLKRSGHKGESDP